MARTPRQKTIANPPAVIREWHPSASSSYPPAEILRRHPAFQWGWEDAPAIKIRQAVRGVRRGHFGKFPSRKMQRSIRARSDLEFDCIRWMEFDPEVEAYVERPVILRYWDGERWRLHIPDLFVRRVGGLDSFIEVAFEEMASAPKLEAKFAAIGQAVAALGYGYSLLTERHIRAEPAFSSLKTLFLRDGWTALPGPEDCALLQSVLADGPLSLASVARRAPAISVRQLRALALRGFLKLDLGQPLTDESMVQLSGRMPIRYRGPIE